MKKSSSSKYYFILGAIGVLYLLIQLGGEEEKSINWMESFSRKDKIPYGTYILFREMDAIFPEAEVFETRETVYETLNDWDHYDEYSYETNYIFINSDFDLDETDQGELFFYVERGNSVFIAARFFPDILRDSLGFETGAELFGLAEGDSLPAKYYNPFLPKRRGFDFNTSGMVDHFIRFDTLRTEVLACNNQGNANLIRINWGEGAFYICSSPRVLTNYHLLHEENHRYVSHALSHLPKHHNIIWDEYYKRANLLNRKMSGSPLQYIFSQPALKYAFWLIVISVIVYVLFEIKRTQRIVPIIKPLPNSTKEFTETVGELYYKSKNHKTIADKKIKIFLEHIRSRYFLKTEIFDEGFQRALSGKSGVPEGEVRALFRKIYGAERIQYITETELMELSQQIELFLKKEAGAENG